MTPEKAKELMAEAIKAMLDCGQFKVVHTTAIRTPVNGEMTNVMCLLLGDSEEALKVIAERAAEPRFSESN